MAYLYSFYPTFLSGLGLDSALFYLLAVLALLFLSAVISGYEVAFFSLNPQVLEDLQNQRRHFSDRIILKLHRHPQRLLATILLSNNLVNVGLILLLAFLFGQIREDLPGSPFLWFVVEAGVITGVLLLLGEITPKVYATYRQLHFLRMFSPVLQLLFYVFYPLSWLLARSTRFLYRNPEGGEDPITFQELKNAIDLTDTSDTPHAEKQILKALVNLNNISVGAVLRARVDVQAFDVSWTNEAVFDYINKAQYSRYPVYADNLDDIRGVLHIKDLLPVLENDKLRWQDYIRKAFFIPENKRIGYLLKEFREKRLHLAIVVDEFGGTEGIVTLQDVLDEIFGEIREETNREEELVQRYGDNDYLVMAKTPLMELCRHLQLDDEYFDGVRGDNDTLGGLVLEMLGKFPRAGQELTFGVLHFQVIAVSAKRILQIRVRRQEENREAETGS